MQENKLKNRIMRRIYGIWFIKRIVPMALGSALFIDLALKIAANRFFVSKIFTNFLAVAGSNIWSVPNFIATAMYHVEPSTMVLISASGLVGFVLAVKLWQSLRGAAFSSKLNIALGRIK